MDRKSDNVAFEDKTKARRAYANMILFFQRLSTTQLIIKDKLFCILTKLLRTKPKRRFSYLHLLY